MTINKTGIGLIAFFLLAGLALMIVPVVVAGASQVAGILGFLGLIWVVVALGLAWYGRRQAQRSANQDRIFRTGIRGTATVLASSSHAEINEMPVMKLELDLEIPGRERRRLTKRETMPVFVAVRMEAGLVLPAYADAGDADDFILVW